MKNIYSALANFQRECPVIFKDTSGYGYTYADLPAIFKVIMPLLEKHGLGFTQILRDNGIETVIFHTETAEEIKGFIEVPTDVELKGMNDFQVMGSAFTYYRRYALSSMLGIITDKDTDAAGEQVRKPKDPMPPRTKKDVVDEEESLFARSMAKIDSMALDELTVALTKMEVAPSQKFNENEIAGLLKKMRERKEILEGTKPF